MHTTNSLQGFCLLSMPQVSDERFLRSVILICSHDSDGAMGFVLNHPISHPTFSEIYRELDLSTEASRLESSGYGVDIYQGGPVEKGRGFVLHTSDLSLSDTVGVSDYVSFTSTLGALKRLASDTPPEHAMIMLGYSGWSKGQLEHEISENGWLVLPASSDLVFTISPERKYEAALSTLGISEASLSLHSGHA